MVALELDAVNPITWLGLVTGRITRIEALEALFNERLAPPALLGMAVCVVGVFLVNWRPRA